MTAKELVLKTVNRLPPTASLQEIFDEIALLTAVREGERDADAGRVTPHERVKPMVKKWLKNVK